MESRDWYVKSYGEIFGPIPAHVVAQLAADGKLSRGAELSTDREDWVSASGVCGLEFRTGPSESEGPTPPPLPQPIEHGEIGRRLERHREPDQFPLARESEGMQPDAQVGENPFTDQTELVPLSSREFADPSCGWQAESRGTNARSSCGTSESAKKAADSAAPTSSDKVVEQCVGFGLIVLALIWWLGGALFFTIVLWIVIGGSALLAVTMGFVAYDASLHSKVKDRNWAIAGLGICLGVGCLAYWLIPGGENSQVQSNPENRRQPIRVHPVFQTPVSGQSNWQPAIQVDILQDSEVLGTAELYLTVQSSKFPSSTWVFLPINVGGFQGCRTRFIQLPFEVSPGDVLLFNLLDEDDLTEHEERAILDACRLTGYGVWIGATLWKPEYSRLIEPAAVDGAHILGQAVLWNLSRQRFDNYGTAEYIVQADIPDQPYKANRVTVLDSSNSARVQIRMYGPKDPLIPSPEQAKVPSPPAKGCRPASVVSNARWTRPAIRSGSSVPKTLIVVCAAAGSVR